jgi:Protein of unknown function (DUF2599)
MQFHRIRTAITTALAAVAIIGVCAAPASASPAQSGRPAAAASQTYVVSASWVTGQYGTTLTITPTNLTRLEGITAAGNVMGEALSIAGMPPYSPAVYNSLMEQLECHLFLLIKTPYNLDTWRPSVSWATELKDLCNPGYPHLG